MKCFNLILFCSVFCCLACSRSVDVDITENAPKIDEVLVKPNLKVLDVGNSYTNDATAYLPLLVNELGVDVQDMCLYKAFRGGASFKSWYNVYNNLDEDGYSISRVLGGLETKVQEGDAEPRDGSLFRKLITEETWDIIIFHQLGRYSTSYDEWFGHGADGYLQDLIDIVRDNQPNCVIGFLLIHSCDDEYPTNTEKSSLLRWQNIAIASQKLLINNKVGFIIPYGTAIQNLRTTDLNNEHELTRDGAHLGVGLAQYTAACCYYESLIAPRTGVSILGKHILYSIKEDPETSKISVTDENINQSQKAAILACLYPFYCINPGCYSTEELLSFMHK